LAQEDEDRRPFHDLASERRHRLMPQLVNDTKNLLAFGGVNGALTLTRCETSLALVEQVHYVSALGSDVASVAWSAVDDLVATGTEEVDDAMMFMGALPCPARLQIRETSLGRKVRPDAEGADEVLFSPARGALAALFKGRASLLAQPGRAQVLRSGSSAGGAGDKVVWRPDGRALLTTQISPDVGPANVMAAMWMAMAQAVISRDQTNRAVLANGPAIWDLTTGAKMLSLPIEKKCLSAAFTRNGRSLITLDEGGVKCWDATAGKRMWALGGRYERLSDIAEHLAMSPDGQHVAIIDEHKQVTVRGTGSGQVVCVLAGQTNVHCCTFSPDGRIIATGGVDRQVRLWNSNTGQQLHCLRGHKYAICSVMFRQSNREVISIDSPGAGEGSDSSAIENDPSTWEDVAPTLKLWDSATGRELVSVSLNGLPIQASATCDGKRLAVSLLKPIEGGKEFSTGVEVWDLDKCKSILSLYPPRVLRSGDDFRMVVSSIAFSPDGHRLATASADGAVKIWDGSPWTETDQKRVDEGKKRSE
jgi:hypothetical protein